MMKYCRWKKTKNNLLGPGLEPNPDSANSQQQVPTYIVLRPLPQRGTLQLTKICGQIISKIYIQIVVYQIDVISS